MTLDRILLFSRRPGLMIGLLCPLLGAVAARGGVEAQTFLRGDANGDGVVSVSDILTIRRYLFIGGIELSCIDAADADDGQPVDGCNCNPRAGSFLNFSDGIIIIRYLFIQDGWSSILPEAAWKTCGGSLKEVASRLGVHKRTIAKMRKRLRLR